MPTINASCLHAKNWLPLLACLAALFLASCTSNKPASQTQLAEVIVADVHVEEAASNDTVSLEETEPPAVPKQTRLRYLNFTLLIHNFWAFGGGTEYNGAGYEYQLRTYPANLPDTLQATLIYH